jgi:hypothetical protein
MPLKRGDFADCARKLIGPINRWIRQIIRAEQGKNCPLISIKSRVAQFSLREAVVGAAEGRAAVTVDQTYEFELSIC